MPSWTNNLKHGDSRPKLDHTRVKIKEDEETGEIFFATYNSETKQDEIIASPINGVVIGNAIMLEGYDNALKSSYRSNYIFNTGTFTTQIYKPGGGTIFDSPVSYQQAKTKMTELVGNATKCLYVFFVFSMDDNKTYAIQCNMSLGIEADKKIGNAKKDGKVLTITPIKYTKDADVSKKIKEMLGKLALKNPPKYLDFKIGDPISDVVASESGLLDAIEQFNKYSEVVVNTREEKTEEHHADVEGLVKPPKKSGGVDVSDMISEPVTDEDDLPF